MISSLKGADKVDFLTLAREIADEAVGIIEHSFSGSFKGQSIERLNIHVTSLLKQADIYVKIASQMDGYKE
jgi:hypothetical protein